MPAHSPTPLTPEALTALLHRLVPLRRFEVASQLGSLIAGSWSLATALSLMAWYVFAPQCISTIAAVRRETNGWRYPLLMVGYLFAMAYAASFVTYRVALALGGG